MSVVISQGSKPVMASEAITVSTTAVTLSSSKYTNTTNLANEGRRNAKQAMITVEAQPIRISIDPAVTPTSTVGHLFTSGDVIWLETSQQIRDFKAIRQGGTDAALYVSYFGE